MMRIIKVLYKISNMGDLARFRRPHETEETSNCDCQVFLFISLAKELARSRLRLGWFPTLKSQQWRYMI